MAGYRAVLIIGLFAHVTSRNYLTALAAEYTNGTYLPTLYCGLYKDKKLRASVTSWMHVCSQPLYR